MKKKIKPVPKFRNEQDEREFWRTHDTTEYFDFSKSSRVEIEFDRGIEAPVKSISLRLPREMLNQLKVLANKKGYSLSVAHQSLLGGKDRRRAKSELEPWRIRQGGPSIRDRSKV